MYNLVVFASGNGSTLQSIIDAIDKKELHSKIVLVVSNNPDAFALERAKKANIPTYVIKNKNYQDIDNELYEVLKAFKEEDANGNGDPDDEIPLAFNGMPDFLFQYLGEAVDSRTYCYVNDGQLAFAPVSDIYHTYLEFFAKLYAEGLILDTCFTITGEELQTM